MQSLSKNDGRRIEKISNDNLTQMDEINKYLCSKIDWVIKICDRWKDVLTNLADSNRSYNTALTRISNYTPSELVSDDIRNIDVSPEFSKIGVVMSNIAMERREMERQFMEGFINPVLEQFDLLKEHQTIIKNNITEMTDICKMDVITGMKTLNANFKICTDLLPISNRLRQKFTEDEQRNKKIIDKLHKTNLLVQENHLKCRVTANSLNQMFEYYKTEYFPLLMKFVSTGLMQQVSHVLDLILETSKQHVGLEGLNRQSLDDCFTAAFDNEESPAIDFIPYKIPGICLEQSGEVSCKDITEKIMMEKNLRVQLLAKAQVQTETLNCSLDYLNKQTNLLQSLRSYGRAYSHLFATQWLIKKLDEEIKTCCLIITADSSTSQSNYLFDLNRKMGAWRFIMFGGRIEDRHNGMDIHPVILVCTKHIRRLGINAEGLFRIPGGQSRIDRLMACLEGGIDYYDSSINTYASVLKAYFRGLRHPPISMETFRGMFQFVDGTDVSSAERIAEIKKVVQSIDPIAWLRLRYKFHLLADVVEHCQEGKMNCRNLSTIFGMLYCSYFDNDQEICKMITKVVEVLISHARLIFPSHVGGVCYPDGLDYLDKPDCVIESRISNDPESQLSAKTSITKDEFMDYDFISSVRDYTSLISEDD